MQKLYGIIPSDDGTFVKATLIKDQKGWKFLNATSWGVQNSLRNTLLLDKNVMLGLDSHWVHQNVPEYNDMRTALSDINFIVCTHTAQYQLYSDQITNNLSGVYPSDAYLCTIPLFMSASPSESFVTIAQEQDAFKIAIIIERRLIATYSCLICDTRQLQGFLARIKRYWTGLNSGKLFPETTYLLNISNMVLEEINNVRNISYHVTDSNTLKAIGVALCNVEPVVPRFSGPTPASRFKLQRSVLLAAAASLVLITLLSFVAVSATNLFLKYKIVESQNKYNAVLVSNKEIRDLLKSGETLSDKLMRVEAFTTQQTSWAKLMQILGVQRPKGLYLEKLGSEPSQESSDMKIAIVGWAGNETVVTELLKNLNTSRVVTGATLASLQRDEKHTDICRFRILCLMKLPGK